MDSTAPRRPGRLARASRGSWQSRLATVLALGYSRLWGGTPAFDEQHGIYVGAGMRGGFARGGTTVGGVFLTRKQPGGPLVEHEAVHADQWARFGLTFPFRYWREELRNPGVKNRFEIEAGLEKGNYRVSKDGRA